MANIGKTVLIMAESGNKSGAEAMVKAAGDKALAAAYAALARAAVVLGQVRSANLAAVEAVVVKAPDNVPGRQARTAFSYARKAWPKDPEAVASIVRSAREAFADGAFAATLGQVETLEPVARAIDDAYRAEALARKAVSWGKQGKATTLAWSSK